MSSTQFFFFVIIAIINNSNSASDYSANPMKPSRVSMDLETKTMYGPMTSEPAPSISHRIIGGNTVSFLDRPYIAQLFIDGFVCGGGILFKRRKGVIITAAHCTDISSNTNRYSVRIGCNNGFDSNCDEGRTFSVATIIQHPEYDARTITNDIALLILTERIDVTGSRRLSLPADNIDQFAGDFVDLLGYGNDDDGRLSSALKVVTNIPVLSNSECSLIWIGSITDGMLCDFENDSKSSCSGDSGSPVVLNTAQRTVVGLVSWGDSRCSVNVPSVNTRVSAYLTWIAENIPAGSRGRASEASVHDIHHESNIYDRYSFYIILTIFIINLILITSYFIKQSRLQRQQNMKLSPTDDNI